jgi:transposase
VSPGRPGRSGAASRTRSRAGAGAGRCRRWSPPGLGDELVLDGIATAALGTVRLASTAGKAPRDASGARGGGEAARGRSRGGLTTTSPALVDGRGRPWGCLLPPAPAADCRPALTVLAGLAVVPLLGDRGDDPDDSRNWGAARDVAAVIPSTQNRQAPSPHDRQAYTSRHKVETLVCRIKDVTRIVVRKGKTARSYAGFVSLAVALVPIKLCP